jgi:hypothetical protein
VVGATRECGALGGTERPPRRDPAIPPAARAASEALLDAALPQGRPTRRYWPPNDAPTKSLQRSNSTSRQSSWCGGCVRYRSCSAPIQEHRKSSTLTLWTADRPLITRRSEVQILPPPLTHSRRAVQGRSSRPALLLSRDLSRGPSSPKRRPRQSPTSTRTCSHRWTNSWIRDEVTEGACDVRRHDQATKCIGNVECCRRVVLMPAAARAAELPSAGLTQWLGGSITNQGVSRVRGPAGRATVAPEGRQSWGP